MSLPSSATFAASSTNFLKASVLATKSVSQFTSARASALPSTAEARAMMPSFDSLSTRLAATASPFSRRYLMASCMSPFVAMSASLQAPMPAAVASRSSLICAIVTVISNLSIFLTT